jgi:hypothetical protein
MLPKTKPLIDKRGDLIHSPPSLLNRRFKLRSSFLLLIAAEDDVEAINYLPKIRSVNEPGTIGGRGRGRSAVGAGVGPNSAVTINTRCVF